MKKTTLVIVVLFIIFTSNIIAQNRNYSPVGQSSTFFKNGKSFVGVIDYLSRRQRNSKIGFVNQEPFNLNSVWMMNFVNNKWNFPNEHRVLHRKHDTIFLKNGKSFYDRVMTYSQRQKVFRFKRTADIKVADIKRIYFSQLPEAYRGQKDDNHNNQVSKITTFIADGRVKYVGIKFINEQKTFFVDGLQVNSKDLVMINFENKKKNFPEEWRLLSNMKDTVFLNNGKYIIRMISAINFNEGKIVFQDESELSLKKIIRIYFKGHKGTFKTSKYGNKNRIYKKKRLWEKVKRIP